MRAGTLSPQTRTKPNLLEVFNTIEEMKEPLFLVDATVEREHCLKSGHRHSSGPSAKGRSDCRKPGTALCPGYWPR